MDWTYILFDIVVFVACVLGVRNLWRRIRSGDLSIWEIKENLKQISIAAAAVFILCLVIYLFLPGEHDGWDFLRAYVVLLLFVLILWGIGHERSKHYDGS